MVSSSKMKNGKCPKCTSRDIWMSDVVKPFPLGMWHGITLKRYFCLACGLTEEYVASEELQDPDKMEIARRKLMQVPSHGK